jgi:hypothetical protein
MRAGWIVLVVAGITLSGCGEQPVAKGEKGDAGPPRAAGLQVLQGPPVLRLQ